MNRKKWLAVALAAILAALILAPTLAYYTVIGRATNVVTSGDIRLAIYEKTADGKDFPSEGVTVIPGDVVDKRVTVGNVCGHPFYLRVQLISGADDSTLSPEECMLLDINTEAWTYADGYYYYNEILTPWTTTEPLFTQVEIPGDQVDQTHIGSMLYLTVSAQAVQSENNPAENPWDAVGWPAE